MRTPGRARAPVARTVAAAFLAAAMACAPQGRVLDPGPTSFWLSANGFDGRAGWSSTVVHMDPDQIGGATRITFLLDDVPEIALLRARGVGWGVHLRGPGGEVACELDVWLNGTERLRLPTSPVESVDGVVPARLLTGLEVHRGSEGPVQDPEGCGALLLWSEEVADPGLLPFRGRVVGRVRGALADTVVAVRLEPDGQRIRPDRAGRYELAGVVPGVYEVVFMAASGPLFRRSARVYAYADTRVDVEVTR